jgi:hypothetical protein
VPERPTARTVARHFGTWHAALQAAAIEPPEWDRDGIIIALHRWAQLNARPPALRDWRPTPPACPTTTIARHSGIWNAALAAAALTARPRPVPITEPEMRTALQAFMRDRNHAPSSTEWHRTQQRPSINVILRHYGSWSAALAAAQTQTPPSIHRPQDWPGSE